MNDSEQIRKAKSVINTFNILKIACEDPTNIPEPILEACKSQGTLAALDLPEHGICCMALNTMKTHADNNGDILWKNLNMLRSDVLIKYNKYIQSQNKPTRGSNAHLREKPCSSEREITKRE